MNARISRVLRSQHGHQGKKLLARNLDHSPRAIAARTLAKRGVNVAVFEAETFGWGASSRNGGMVLTGMKLPAPTLITSGATMTYSSPAWPHGIRNGLAKSGRVLRNCQDASTVRMVTPMRSQTYTVKSCTIVFCASSA